MQANPLGATQAPESSLDLVLAATSGQTLIPLASACHLAGINKKTWRNWESEGNKNLPFPATSAAHGPRRVHVADLAEYIDSIRPPRRVALPAPVATEPTVSPKRRGRPTNASRAAHREGGAK